MFALLFVLLLVTGPTCASAASCGEVTAIGAALYTLYQVYKITKAVWWTWKFADYLLDEHQVKNIPAWLSENPPTFTFFTMIVRSTMSTARTEVMKRYARWSWCDRSDDTCSKTLAFMKTF